jgi:hypothetical protein
VTRLDLKLGLDLARKHCRGGWAVGSLREPQRREAGCRYTFHLTHGLETPLTSTRRAYLPCAQPQPLVRTACVSEPASRALTACVSDCEFFITTLTGCRERLGNELCPLELLVAVAAASEAARSPDPCATLSMMARCCTRESVKRSMALHAHWHAVRLVAYCRERATQVAAGRARGKSRLGCGRGQSRLVCARRRRDARPDRFVPRVWEVGRPEVVVRVAGGSHVGRLRKEAVRGARRLDAARPVRVLKDGVCLTCALAPARTQPRSPRSALGRREQRRSASDRCRSFFCTTPPPRAS